MRSLTVPTGNLRLDHLLGACRRVDIHSSAWDQWEARAAVLEADLRRDGRTVYRMPIGGSTVVGGLGYVAAMSEILDDEQRLGVHFETIVLASSSAGTQAGLVVGQAIAQWPGQVLGFSVAKDQERQRREVFALAQETAGRLGTVDRPEHLSGSMTPAWAMVTRNPPRPAKTPCGSSRANAAFFSTTSTPGRRRPDS